MAAVLSSGMERAAGLVTAGLMTSGLLTTGYYWFNEPVVLLKGYLKYTMLRAGLKERFVPVGEHHLSYCERGEAKPDRPTMLMVHGFTASKDMWVPTVRQLPRNIHIVLVDLPGHGQSSIPDQSTEASVDMLADTLHDFITVTGLSDQPLHLIGISLGGAVCAIYSTQHPDNLDRLTLICPAIPTPLETPFQRNMRIRSGCPLIPDTVEGVQDMINMTRYKKSRLPRQLLRAILDMRRPRNAFYWRFYRLGRSIFRMDQGKWMEQKCRGIMSPVQVIWGDHDEVIHVTGVERLRELLPNIRQIDVLTNCGHSCNMDSTNELAEKLSMFNDKDLVETPV